MNSDKNQCCQHPQWRYCEIENDMCKNCENGRDGNVIFCKGSTTILCEFETSASFPNGVCSKCARIVNDKNLIEQVTKILENDPNTDVDLLVYHIDDIIFRYYYRGITVDEVRKICDLYYKQLGETQENLNKASKLFMELDHILTMRNYNQQFEKALELQRK